MKICPKCNAQNADNTAFCANCGLNFAAAHQAPPQYAHAPAHDPYDHTAEFSPKDISDNKVVAMLVYLLGTVGIIIALLLNSSSAYVGFHLRQALKFVVTEVLLGLAIALLCWTIIVPIAGAILYLILNILKIVCFFQICSGKAKEPAIIRSLNFLR